MSLWFTVSIFHVKLIVSISTKFKVVIIFKHHRLLTQFMSQSYKPFPTKIIT